MHEITTIDLRPQALNWHSSGVLPPWVITELEEEQRRREEEERSRGARIELPQMNSDDEEAAKPAYGGVIIMDISPRSDAIDL